MTEPEAITALTEIAALALAHIGAWLSLTFAYLTVAYFAGRSLSKFQCWTVSILYGVMGFLFASPVIGYVDGWLLLYARESTIFDEVSAFSAVPFYVEGWTFFTYGGVLVSLYFMYNVRHTEKM